jgi:hypothetical protein
LLARVFTRLDDDEIRFFENEKDAVRLNSTRNMDRLSIAIRQIDSRRLHKFRTSLRRGSSAGGILTEVYQRLEHGDSLRNAK